MRSAVAAWTLLLSAVTFASCGGSSYRYEPPTPESDGWSVGSAAEAGFDLQILGEMVDHVHDRSDCAVHGILIVKDDRLVFEEYFDGYRFDYDDPGFRGESVAFDSTTRHTLMSVTKAVPAAMIGIAIDDGLIQGVAEPVVAAFPQYGHLVQAGADEITVEHLLTMTSGLEWNEWDVPLTDSDNDLIQLFIVSDPIEYILTKPVTHEPGSYWYYSGGDVNLLGEYFEAITGVGIDDFSVSHLFEPLGISDYQWQYITPDVVYVSGELELRPRDMAKFGFLYLNDGVWNGTQVIPPDWIGASLEEHVAIPGRTGEGDGYTYQWFTQTYEHGGVTIEAVQRTGWGGQALVLFPTLDMMVALTGGDYLLQCQLDDLLTEYIIPALEPGPDESAD